jgi:O-antigen/teichoic acid export membrane protein
MGPSSQPLHDPRALPRLVNAATAAFRGRDSRIATAGTLATSFAIQALVVVSGVLAARMLGVSGRGHLAILWVIAIILAQVGTLGLPIASTYFIARDERNAAAIARSLVIPALVQSVVFLILHALILTVALHDAEAQVKLSAALTLPVVPSLIAYQYGLAILQGLQRFRAFNVQRILAQSLYTFGLLACFAIGLSDLPDLMFVWVAAVVVVSAITLARAVRALPQRRGAYSQGPRVSEMLRFGLKSLLGAMSVFDQLQLDQAVAALLLPPFSLGLYVAAVAFTNLPRFIGQSVGMVAYPTAAKADSTREGRRTMWRFFAVAALASGLTVAALELLVGRLIDLFFGSTFDGATEPARILLLGSLCLALRRTLADGARGAGYPTVGTVAEVFSWVLLIPALVVFVSGSATSVALALSVTSFTALVLLLGGLWVLKSAAYLRRRSAVQPPPVTPDPPLT